MSAIAELKKKFDEEVKQLQESCPHEQLSPWFSEMWGPGRFTGRDLQVCENCAKSVHTKWWCAGCGVEQIDAAPLRQKPSVSGQESREAFCLACSHQVFDPLKRPAPPKSLSAYRQMLNSVKEEQNVVFDDSDAAT